MLELHKIIRVLYLAAFPILGLKFAGRAFQNYEK